jgi:hypothetical protein
VIATAAAGSNGSATASTAVAATHDPTQRSDAKVAFIGAHRPVDDARLDREQLDPPPDER